MDFSSLYDVSRPVHCIATALEPYLRILVDEFHAQHIVLFGSYAYGSPNEHSDVDLLVIKSFDQSSLKDAIAIKSRWRDLRHQMPYVSIDLLVESPERHAQRLAGGGAFYADINLHGLQLL